MKALTYERPSAFPKWLWKNKWDTCSDKKNDDGITWFLKVFCYKTLLGPFSAHVCLVWSWRSPAMDPSQAICSGTSFSSFLENLLAATAAWMPRAGSCWPTHALYGAHPEVTHGSRGIWHFCTLSPQTAGKEQTWKRRVASSFWTPWL